MYSGFGNGYPSQLNSQFGAQMRQIQNQFNPPSNNQRPSLPTTFSDDLDDIFTESSWPPPVPAAGQNYANLPIASHHGSQAPLLSSFQSDRPMFPDAVRSLPAPRALSDDPFLSSLSDLFELLAGQYDNSFSGPSQDTVSPYVDSAAASFAARFDELSQIQPPDVLSADGICSVPLGSQDIPALNESLPLRHPSPSLVSRTLLGHQSGSRSRTSKPLELQFHPYLPSEQLKLRGVSILKDKTRVKSSQSQMLLSPIGPPMYNEGIKAHQEIFENAQASRIRSALNSNPFLSEQEKKAEALAALIASASIYEQGGQLFLYKIQLTFVKDTGKQWAENNMAEFYKTNSVPSANIMTTCKKYARSLVQRRCDLRPSVWDHKSESEHQMQTACALISSFPPLFIFGRDEFGRLWPFENDVLLDIVLNTIMDLRYELYLTDLKAMFSTASAALQCALQERVSRGLTRVDFDVPHFKPVFQSFETYIEEVVEHDLELSARWQRFQECIFATLRDIKPPRPEKEQS
ncbi:hypothetical protein EDD22DRAFT_853621 [Suillus occidentalis]|nr:hypothetical protein EDD22DRAFT_853621 [Suillus occidentalis]